MHPTRPLLSLLLSGSLVLLAGCSSPSSPNAIMDRVDANRDVYESWSLDIKDAVLSGQVLRGMTTDMVYVARGKPDERIERGGGDEIWIYRIGGGGGGAGSLLRGTTVTVGTGGGGGYPSGYPTGYPSGYPGGMYPSAGGGISVPVTLGGGGGNSDPGIEEQIVFRNGKVTHGDGVK